MAANARKVIEKIAELDTELGWRPETRAEAMKQLAAWRAEAKDAVRAGVKRGSPSIYLEVDDWFEAIVGAFDTLGMKTAAQVYLNYIFGRRSEQAHATRRKAPAQLDREIAEALAGRKINKHVRTAHATRRVLIGNGLKDGVGTAGAGYRLKKLRETGATDISLASTGRLRFTRNGQRYEYQVTPPQDRREADAFVAAGTVDSPLSRALADITAAES